MSHGELSDICLVAPPSTSYGDVLGMSILCDYKKVPHSKGMLPRYHVFFIFAEKKGNMDCPSWMCGDASQADKEYSYEAVERT